MSLRLYIDYLNHILTHVKHYEHRKIPYDISLEEIYGVAQDLQDLFYLDSIWRKTSGNGLFFESYDFLLQGFYTNYVYKLLKSNVSDDIKDRVLENCGALLDEGVELFSLDDRYNLFSYDRVYSNEEIGGQALLNLQSIYAYEKENEEDEEDFAGEDEFHDEFIDEEEEEEEFNTSDEEELYRDEFYVDEDEEEFEEEFEENEEVVEESTDYRDEFYIDEEDEEIEDESSDYRDEFFVDEEENEEFRDEFFVDEEEDEEFEEFRDEFFIDEEDDEFEEKLEETNLEDSDNESYRDEFFVDEDDEEEYFEDYRAEFNSSEEDFDDSAVEEYRDEFYVDEEEDEDFPANDDLNDSVYDEFYVDEDEEEEFDDLYDVPQGDNQGYGQDERSLTNNVDTNLHFSKGGMRAEDALADTLMGVYNILRKVPQSIKNLQVKEGED